ncbi:site-specific DNA-methyltransferase [Haloferula sp. A504]|uniref:site-specific DNA-methyltransferase n=1 Tax=Haloferula sp. A504 TaxID=3373601 RepID=UPI0031BC6E48|nr:site-specific DNA-methyltransferase [Verrucomicrobiaceae bacterium E54]
MSDDTTDSVTLDDLLPTTPDLRAERLAELKRLFPDLFTNEGRLNPDELKRLVEPNEVHETERYEFKWYGKAASKREAFTPTTATLVYDEERSVNPDKADGNMIIEGENLETLKLLLNAYREQVKCIYIDPPYNTGSDFIYKDDYAREVARYWEDTGETAGGVKLTSNPDTSGRYHSDWLSMIHTRLLVARSLLSEAGAIFISIDDHEVANLRRVADEVFGRENFVAQFIWQKMDSPSRNEEDRFHSNYHEYLLVYQRTEKCHFSRMAKEKILDAYPLTLADGRKARRRQLRKNGKNARRKDRPTMWYALESPDKEEIWPIHPKEGWEGRWVLSKGEWKNRSDAGLTEWIKRDYGWAPYYIEIAPQEPTIPWPSIMDYVEQNRQAKAEFTEIMGSSIEFETPKPASLLKAIIEMASNDDDLVMDFFAGSGTFAQAVLQRPDDLLRRKFIVVQVPDSIPADDPIHDLGFKAISSITIERIKRVIEGYGDDPQPIPDAGFKVYRLAKSNFPRCEFKPDPEATDEENVESLRRYIEEKEAAFFLTLDEAGERAVFDEVLLKNGFQLHYSRERRDDFADNTVWEIADPRRKALVCLAWSENIQDATIARLRELAETGDKPFFICLERSLSTTAKWNLKHLLGNHFNAF